MPNIAKAFEAVMPEEYETNPIWEMAFDASEQPGWNETWRKPVIGLRNLDDNSVGYFIALKIPNTSYIANALFYDKSIFPLTSNGIPHVDWIAEIHIWKDNKWLAPIQLSDADLKCPVHFEAVPDIRNESKVTFVMNNKVDNCASRIN